MDSTKSYTNKMKDLILSTRSFYNKSNSMSIKEYRFINISPSQNRRRSYSEKLHYNRKSQRRHTLEGVNGGVSHGIKKQKAKSSSNSTKENKNNSSNDSIEEFPQTIRNVQSKTSEISCIHTRAPVKRGLERSPTPEIYLNVKLKVASDGEVSLNQEKLKSVSPAHKRQKLMDNSFDTTDLMVDEPSLEDTIEKTDIANILKVLEDDWADDDYDTMDILTNKQIGHISPVKLVAILNNVTMSPAKELCDLTNVDIKGISRSLTFESTPLSFDNNKNNIDKKEPKYYPLFNKGYSSSKACKDVGKKSTDNTKNINWQLSMKKNGSDNQYQIDAGQKQFGATECTECGVVYQIGDPEDENAHLNYHNNKKCLKFSGWKTERVIMEDPVTMSRVILVEPNNLKQNWIKIEEVLTYVDRDLGLADANVSDYEQKKIYLYIRNKTILGVLVAEQITTAHRMIPELIELDCCTEESTPAKCGINVLWTEIKHRKQGIASKLVDILRSQFYYGYIMSLDDIAFSIPTQSGKIFAEKYTKTRNFKVYS